MTIEFYVIRNGKGAFLKEDGNYSTDIRKARTFDKEIDVQFYLKRGRNLWALASEMVIEENRASYNSKLIKING